ncbi:MAG: hypothetical protein ACYSO1_08315, partial [Planctomycetota bacterium]
SGTGKKIVFKNSFQLPLFSVTVDLLRQLRSTAGIHVMSQTFQLGNLFLCGKLLFGSQFKAEIRVCQVLGFYLWSFCGV